MKKLTIIIIAIIFFAINAFSQNNKKMELKKFDFDLYEKLKTDENTGLKSYTDSLSVKIEFFKSTINNELRCYGEIHYYPNSLSEYIYIYTPQGDLRKYTKKYSNLKNKVIEYNSHGKIIENIDYDKDYSFSVEQLIEKMKNEYNIILDNREKMFVNRYKSLELDKLVYVIVIYRIKDDFYLLIDGTNGETLVTQTYPNNFPVSKRKNIVQIYLNAHPEAYKSKILVDPNKNQDEPKSFWQRLFK